MDLTAPAAELTGHRDWVPDTPGLCCILVAVLYYLQGPHLITVGLAELLILVAAAALVGPDAARAQTVLPAPPPRPQLG